MNSRHNGPPRLPGRGPDHEEAAAPEADPALRRLHPGGAHLHHHRADEERKLARVPVGQGSDPEAAPAHRHRRSGILN